MAPVDVKPTVLRTPVLGLKLNFVELVLFPVIVPVVALVNNGYRVAFVVVSSVTVMPANGVVQVGALAPAEVITCPLVPVEPLNAMVEVTFKVVCVPAAAVVAPTVPLILIEAVPVRFVTVPLEGVPRAPPLTTNAPADPVLTPSAVTTPVPVVVVAGAAPAPPPITSALAARAAEVAQVVPLEK